MITAIRSDLQRRIVGPEAQMPLQRETAAKPAGAAAITHQRVAFHHQRLIRFDHFDQFRVVPRS